MRVLIHCRPGIGNMLQAIPLIKECLHRGWDVSVYPDADSSCGKKVFNEWGQVKVVHSFVGKYDRILRSPYNKGTKSISGKHVPWSKATEVGESTLYCRLLDGDYPEHDITAPLWSSRKFPGLKDHIVIWPGCKSNWPVKRWLRFHKLALHFKKVVVIGQSKHMYIKYIPKHCVSLVDKLSYLPDIVALIHQCRAYIGNDGGISHLAATTGVPTNIIFGFASVVKNRPRGEHVNIISKDLECVPCQGKPGSSHTRCKRWGKVRCMTELGWEEVLDQIRL